MKRKSTLISLLALLGLCLQSQQAKAQDTEPEIVGYTNVWYQIVASPNGGGKVCASPNSNSIKVWRDEFPFKQAVPVGQILGSNITLFYIYAKPADGFVFAGWYFDADGDGQLDTSKDQLLSEDAEHLQIDALNDDATVYATQAEAKQGASPAVPLTLFAYFTNGAVISTSYYQDNEHAGCGSVFVDKPINSPGDEITVRALPNDGFQFEYWQSESLMGDIISRENPYTFTVKGGERLYAYFTAIDAPQAELPADGGYKVIITSQPWVLSEQSLREGAHVVVPERDDLVKTADGKTYLDITKEEALVDVTQINGVPTIVSGKGTVRFAYKMNYGIARERANDALVHYSGTKGATCTGENIYVYTFNEQIGAFVQYGNTDKMINPDAPDKVTVSPQLVYIAISAYDIVDDQGQIPVAIGLSADTFDRAVAGIDGARVGSRTIQNQKVYTLSGVALPVVGQKGLYIIGGRKVVVNNK